MPRSEQRAEVMTLLSQMADKFNSLADDHERMASLLGQIPALRDAAPRWRTAPRCATLSRRRTSRSGRVARR